MNGSWLAWRLSSKGCTREVAKQREAHRPVQLKLLDCIPTSQVNLHGDGGALTMNQLLITLALFYQILVSPNRMKVYRRAFPWRHQRASNRLWGAPCWLEQIITWLKLRDSAGSDIIFFLCFSQGRLWTPTKRLYTLTICPVQQKRG